MTWDTASELLQQCSRVRPVTSVADMGSTSMTARVLQVSSMRMLLKATAHRRLLN